MVSVSHSGSFKNLESFSRKIQKLDIMKIMHKYGQKGVDALSLATPIDTSLASRSWYYEVVQKGSMYIIYWCNDDIENGFPVAVMLQYGYATGTGGYVPPRDYINPAMRPIFDEIIADVWREVTSG